MVAGMSFDLSPRPCNLNVAPGASSTSDALFARSPVPMWVRDVATSALLAVNQAAADLFGSTRHALLTRGVDRRANDALASCELSETPLTVAGRPARLVAAYDVATWKAAEASWRTREQRLRSLIQHSRDLIAIADEVGTILYVSPSAVAVLGYRPDELVGASGLDLEHRDDREKVTSTLARALIEPGQSTAPIEVRARHRNGSVRHLEVVFTSLLGDPAVRGVVVTGRDVTARKQVEEVLAHRDLHDPVTGLPNGNLLTDRLERAMARVRDADGSIVVLCLDIDHFGRVNDVKGRVAGDAVLMGVAHRVRSAMDATDTVARLGDDEFVVVRDRAQPVDPELLTRQVAAALTPPLSVLGEDIFVTASMGVVAGTAGSLPDELLRDAHAALVMAKRAGRGHRTVFDAAMRASAESRFVVESALHRAIEHEELHLVYQPIISLDEGRVVGAEALLRWDHPDRGPVGPAEFIPLAEDSGLIVSLGDWVLRTACLELRAWLETCPGFTLSMNVSARQLIPSLPEAAKDALNNVDASAVRLELTESVLLGDMHAAGAVLIKLRDVGVRLAVDDFGTGYSSLSYLKRLPIDTVKIDRTFIQGLDSDDQDAAIVAAIMAMGGVLGLEVVAEGVERQAHVDRLRDLGCALGQGFYWSQPVAPEAFGLLLREQAGRQSVAPHPSAVRYRPTRWRLDKGHLPLPNDPLEARP